MLKKNKVCSHHVAAIAAAGVSTSLALTTWRPRRPARPAAKSSDMTNNTDVDQTLAGTETRSEKRGKTDRASDRSFYIDRTGQSIAAPAAPSPADETATAPLESDPTALGEFETEAPPAASARARVAKEVSADTIRYFRDIHRVLVEKDFPTEEDRDMMVENVHAEIKGQEAALAANKGCSACLEFVLRKSSAAQLCAFLKGIRGDVFALATDRSASHVVQTALLLTASSLRRETPESRENNKALADALCDVCEEVGGGWVELFFDRYGSHVARTIIQIACGGDDGDKEGDKTEARGQTAGAERVKRPTRNRHLPTRAAVCSVAHVPDRVCSLLSTIAKAVIAADDETTEQLALHANAGPATQALLAALASLGRASGGDTSVCDSLIAKLLFWGSNPDNWGKDKNSRDYFDQLLRDRRGSHMVEALLRAASKRVFAVLLTNSFRGRLADLSVDPLANYPVQALLANAKHGPHVALCFTELAPDIPRVMAAGKLGVVWRLIDACRAHTPSKGPDAVRRLAEALGVAADDEKFVAMLLRHGVAPARVQKSNFNVMGCALVIALLGFPAKTSARVARSAAAAESRDLITLACDPSGSRVLDALLASPGCVAKARGRIVDRLVGNFGDMGCDKYGSYVVQRLYYYADISRKRSIAQELLEAESRLAGTKYGTILLLKCSVHKFKHKQQAWERELTQEQKKLEMFADFFDGPPAPASSSSIGPAAASAPATSAEAAGDEKRRLEDERAAAALGGDDVDAAMGVISGRRGRKSKRGGGAAVDAGAAGGEVTAEIDSLFRSESKKQSRLVQEKKRKRKRDREEKRAAREAARAGSQATGADAATASSAPRRKKSKKKTAR